MDTDAQMVTRVRAGDHDAFGELFSRHRATARRVATRVAPAGEADDIVAESFARVLARIAAGGGPESSFRAYLLAAVRHEASRRRAAGRRSQPVADIEAVAGAVDLSLGDDGLRAAYRGLPERWQHVLWRLEVEGLRPHELAAELGLSPNAVSALGCRARAGLRAAYLREAAA